MIRNGSSILTVQMFSIFRNRSNHLPTICINYKWEKIITGEKPGRHHLAQVFQLNSHTDILCPQDETLRSTCYFWGILAQNIQSQSNHKKTSEKPKARDRL